MANSQSVEQIFERIAAAVEEINRIGQQIAAATEEQTQTSEAINRQTSQLNELSNETAGIVNQNQQVIEHLQRAFGDLRAALTKFG